MSDNHVQDVRSRATAAIKDLLTKTDPPISPASAAQLKLLGLIAEKVAACCDTTEAILETLLAMRADMPMPGSVHVIEQTTQEEHP